MERIIKVDFGSGAEEVVVCDNKYVEPDDEYFAWEREYIKSISPKITNDYLDRIFSLRNSGSQHETIYVIELSKRWNVHWKFIKKSIKDGLIKCDIIDNRFVFISKESGTPFFKARPKIHEDEIKRIENENENLKMYVEHRENIDKYHRESNLNYVYSSIEKLAGGEDNIREYIKTLRNNGLSLANNASAGLSALVCNMRREGKPDEEIAAYLYGGGNWCSQAQIGALLHPDESRVDAESMRKNAARLLKKQQETGGTRSVPLSHPVK